MRLRLGLLSIVVSVLGCARAPDCPPTEAPAPVPTANEASAHGSNGSPAVRDSAEPPADAAVILLVRHAEKAKDGTSDPPLTDRGVRRAQCLARLLGSFAPTHLLSTQYQRTAATLQPLAEISGVEVVVIPAQDGAGWEQALAQLPPDSRAVVAGHSNTVPIWVDGLGGRLRGLDAEGNIPHDEYDRLVHIVRDGSGRVTTYSTAYCTEPSEGRSGP